MGKIIKINLKCTTWLNSNIIILFILYVGTYIIFASIAEL